MKKIIAAALLCATLLLLLTSCGGLSGTYTSTYVGTYEFSGKNYTYTSLVGTKTTGTYEIEDDKITFTPEETSIGGVSVDREKPVTYSFEKGDGTITINKVTYTKQ